MVAARITVIGAGLVPVPEGRISLPGRAGRPGRGADRLLTRAGRISAGRAKI